MSYAYVKYASTIFSSMVRLTMSMYSNLRKNEEVHCKSCEGKT